MLEIFAYAFIRRAFLAGILVAFICPLIGLHLVLRRMSLIGDSLSHIALSGVAIGIITGNSPVLSALVTTSIAALAIEKLKDKFADYGEIAIAIMMSFGMAFAVVLISFARSFNAQLYSYLFGNISAVSNADLIIVFVLSILIFWASHHYYDELFYITLDPTSARLAGVPIKLINTVFILMVAAVITISMRIVGILLISSLIVLPVASAMQLAKSFKQAIILALAFAELAVILGIVISYYLQLAAGGVIVLLLVLQILLVLFVKKSLVHKIKE